jgi:hypothetical protein
MVHLDEPGQDEGVFSTLEVPPQPDGPDDATSRLILFPPNNYVRPPNVAGGFKLLELSHKAPIRANICGSDITKVGSLRLGGEFATNTDRTARTRF